MKENNIEKAMEMLDEMMEMFGVGVYEKENKKDEEEE